MLHSPPANSLVKYNVGTKKSEVGFSLVMDSSYISLPCYIS